MRPFIECTFFSETHFCKASLASLLSFSTSAEFLLGLMARASSGGNSSSSISISGWSRGTRIEALGFRLAKRGRSALDFRSCSVSDIEDEDDERDETCTPLILSLGDGIAGTGSDLLSTPVPTAILWYYGPQIRRSKI